MYGYFDIGKKKNGNDKHLIVLLGSIYLSTMCINTIVLHLWVAKSICFNEHTSENFLDLIACILEEWLTLHIDI